MANKQKREALERAKQIALAALTAHSRDTIFFSDEPDKLGTLSDSQQAAAGTSTPPADASNPLAGLLAYG
jgi:hypothetical protein